MFKVITPSMHFSCKWVKENTTLIALDRVLHLKPWHWVRDLSSIQTEGENDTV